MSMTLQTTSHRRASEAGPSSIGRPNRVPSVAPVNSANTDPPPEDTTMALMVGDKDPSNIPRIQPRIEATIRLVRKLCGVCFHN